MLDVSLPVDEQTDDLMSTLKAGERERRVAIGLDLRVDVAAHVE